MKPDFLSTLLKELDGFSEYAKFLINYQGRKLENCYLNTEKNLVTTIFFEQRKKEKLKGTVMQIENALINDRLRVSKVS